MSSKIYFTESQTNKNIRWYIVRALTELYRRIAPTNAAKRTRALLLKPHRIAAEPLSASLKEQRINTEYGDLVSYEMGKGPVILFVHGWSGSGQQFLPLMKFVTKQGYKAISFDHFGHGQSSHKEANLPLLIKGIDIINHHYQFKSSLLAVVTHSLGAVASMNAFSRQQMPHFLIAPIFDFMQTFFQLVLNTGVSPALLHNLLAEIEAEHNINFSSLDINDRVREYSSTIHIAHGMRDRFSKYHLSEKVAQTYPHITFHSMPDLSHTSILSAPDTSDRLHDFLSRINTPVNTP